MCRRFIWVYGFIFLCGFISVHGCRVDEAPMQVLTTTTMIADMVKAVGGDLVEVESLMAPGVDPHMYRPTAWDALMLRDADVVFYNGLHLEGRMSTLFERMHEKGMPVYAVTQAMDPQALIKPSLVEGAPDPHVWFDPMLWVEGLNVVADALAIKDPDKRGYFKANAEMLALEYEAFHEELKDIAKNIPRDNRLLITSHDAFNYFGHAYDFDVIGVQGISTVTEAGLGDIVRIVDLIKARNVKVIFVETSVSPAVIERISRDAGVSIGGELFSDSLGLPGQMENIAGQQLDVGTYQGMLKYNMLTIVGGLQ